VCPKVTCGCANSLSLSGSHRDGERGWGCLGSVGAGRSWRPCTWVASRPCVPCRHDDWALKVCFHEPSAHHPHNKNDDRGGGGWLPACERVTCGYGNSQFPCGNCQDGERDEGCLGSEEVGLSPQIGSSGAYPRSCSCLLTVSREHLHERRVQSPRQILAPRIQSRSR